MVPGLRKVPREELNISHFPAMGWCLSSPYEQKSSRCSRKGRTGHRKHARKILARVSWLFFCEFLETHILQLPLSMWIPGECPQNHMSKRNTLIQYFPLSSTKKFLFFLLCLLILYMELPSSFTLSTLIRSSTSLPSGEPSPWVLTVLSVVTWSRPSSSPFWVFTSY